MSESFLVYLIFVIIVVIIVLFSFIYFYFFEQKFKRDEILAQRAVSKFFSGGYFKSMAFISAYNRYCEKGKGCTTRPRSLSLRHGITLWRFRYLLIKNFLVMGVVIPVVLIVAVSIWNIFVNLEADTQLISAEYMYAIVLTAIEVIYAGVLYVMSRSVFDTWLSSISEIKINARSSPYDTPAFEAAYASGVMFICRENFVIVSPAYLFIFDGEHFSSLERECIYKLKILAKRIKYYQTMNESGKSYYTSNEYRFRIDFITETHEPCGAELNQYQIKMLIDKYFGELKGEILYREEKSTSIIHRPGIKENRIIL